MWWWWTFAGKGDSKEGQLLRSLCSQDYRVLLVAPAL